MWIFSRKSSCEDGILPHLFLCFKIKCWYFYVYFRSYTITARKTKYCISKILLVNPMVKVKINKKFQQFMPKKVYFSFFFSDDGTLCIYYQNQKVNCHVT
jgi:hypothetical protein